MAKNFVMPKLAMAMNEGTVSEWLVAEGQKVNKGDPVATVETEKVSYDIESPDSGLLHILLPVGEAVAVETVIAVYAENDEEYQQLVAAGGGLQASAEAPAPQAEPAPAVAAGTARPVDTAGLRRTPGERLRSSPLARKMAADNNLDLARLAGSGPGGRIVKRDILDALSQAPPAAGVQALAAIAGNRELARIAMSGVRQTIANRMMDSLQSSAQVSSGWESDITDLLALRKRYVAKAERWGTRVSVNAFVIKAICYAIKQVPIANSRLQDNQIVIFDNVNIGIAIALPGQSEYDSTLLVPVLKNVEDMGLVDIDKSMKQLIQRARDGQLQADETSGSTITLSSTAGIAPPGMTTSPVLNRPGAAIVGPSTPIEKPVVYRGEIVPRTLMPVSFTFDHCIMDGEPAARFMQALHECLEDPGLMMA